MTTQPCSELLGAGYTVEAVAALYSQGHCTHQAPSEPTIPPIQNAVSGAGIPLPMLAIGGLALVTWLLEKASDYGRDQRRDHQSSPAALPGAHLGQPALYPSEPTPEEPWNNGVRPGSGSFFPDSGSARYSPQTVITEPNPWTMTEEKRDTYQQDRTGSDVSTGDVWLVLKDCTFQEFQKRIKPGNIDPTPVIESGSGAIATRDALYKWFQHGITQQNKCCYATFGTDGKGAGATAKAAVQLYKKHLSEWSDVAVKFGDYS